MYYSDTNLPLNSTLIQTLKHETGFEIQRHTQNRENLCTVPPVLQVERPLVALIIITVRWTAARKTWQVLVLRMSASTDANE